MITALDHIALAAAEPDVARAEALLGRKAQGGRFQLANLALEVVAGPVEGLCALAFAADDLGRTLHRLSRVGLAAIDGVLDPAATHGTPIRIVEAIAGPASPFTGDEDAAVSGLDHVVIRTPDPDRAAALYGARLGLEMKLDRTNPDWGTRLMFFRCGDLVIEVAHALGGPTEGPDELWGLSWRVPAIAAANARIKAAGFDVSDIRTGRKPGTRVFTVRDAPAGVPTLILAKEA